MKDEFNRKWKYKIKYHYHYGPYISIVKYLIKGNFPSYEVTKPLIVGEYFINFRIFNWKIEIYHSWYDGPNCYWQFGPLAFGRSGLGHCEKCRDGVE